ncbi:MAG: hypothetical protein LBG78_07280 [Azoarcus sp.]|jgi:hypothetical protein|nr:hypothetical protein [Azoarcus sp.]
MIKILMNILLRIKRLIGTGADAGDSIGFWLSLGIAGVAVVIFLIVYGIYYFIRLLSELL